MSRKPREKPQKKERKKGRSEAVALDGEGNSANINMYNRGIGILLRLIIAIIVICVICRFLGITWADVDNFVDNGMIRGLKLLQFFKGAAHTPL